MSEWVCVCVYCDCKRYLIGTGIKNVIASVCVCLCIVWSSITHTYTHTLIPGCIYAQCIAHTSPHKMSCQANHIHIHTLLCLILSLNWSWTHLYYAWSVHVHIELTIELTSCFETKKPKNKLESKLRWLNEWMSENGWVTEECFSACVCVYICEAIEVSSDTCNWFHQFFILLFA